eukprot:g3249.t1
MGIFDREFPVQVKFSDWSTDDSDVTDYFTSVFVQSGGAGVGMALVLTVIMAIAILLFLWCPCCCFKKCCLCCKVREPKWKEKTNRKVAFTLLFICTLISFTGLGILYPSAITALSETDDTITNVRGTLDDFSDFICGDPLTTSLRNGEDYDTYTTGKTAAEMCTSSSSMSYFLTDTSCKVNSTVGFIETKINNLTALVTALEDLATAFSNFTNYTSTLNTTLYVLDEDLDNLNTSVTNYDTFVNQKTGTYPISESIDVSSYMIPDSYLTSTSDAVDELNNEVTVLDGYVDAARSTVENDLQDTTADELDSTKATITSELNDLQDDLLDFVDTTNDIYESVYDFQTDYFQEYEFYILLGYLIFNGVSVFFLTFQLIAFWRGWRCLSDCCTCCMFLMTFWTCTLLGLSVVGWLLTGDVCDNWWVGNEASNYEGIFGVNLANETVTFGNVTFDVASKIEDVLYCASGCTEVDSACIALPDLAETNQGCDATNNLYDMLQLNETLDFTSDVQTAIDEIDTYAPMLNYSTELDAAVSELYTADVNETLTLVLPINSTALTTYSDELSTAIGNLPSCTFDASHCLQWAAVWGIDPNPLSGCNTAYLGTNSPAGFTENYIIANCNYTTYLQAIVDDIDTIVNGDALVTFNSLQTDLYSSRDTVATAITAVGTATEVATAALEAMADVLATLVLYIPAEAPSHMTCSWISSAWATVVETDYCTNAYENMGNLIAGMALSTLGMVLGFFVMMDFANQMRLRPRALSKEDENAGKMNPHKWNHPGVEGSVIHADTGRVRMAEDVPPIALASPVGSATGLSSEPNEEVGARKKYWNNKNNSHVDVRAYPAAANGGEVDMSDISSLAARHCVVSNVSRITSNSSNLFGL